MCEPGWKSVILIWIKLHCLGKCVFIRTSSNRIREITIRYKNVVSSDASIHWLTSGALDLPLQNFRLDWFPLEMLRIFKWILNSRNTTSERIRSVTKRTLLRSSACTNWSWTWRAGTYGFFHDKWRSDTRFIWSNPSLKQWWQDDEGWIDAACGYWRPTCWLGRNYNRESHTLKVAIDSAVLIVNFTAGVE